MRKVPTRHHAAHQRSLLGFAALLVLIAGLLLASCGVTAVEGLGGNSPSSTTYGPPTTTTKATPTAAPASVPFSGTCSGTIANSAVPTASVMLSRSNIHAVTAQVGQTVGLDMPASYHWTVRLNDPGHALTPINPQGKRDTANNTCHWRFVATSTGSATLDVVGESPCQPPRMCASVALDITYTLTIQR